MKRATRILSIALVAFAFAAPAIAEEGGVNRDINRTEVANFDKYLDSHPDVAKQLQQNPQLVNNREFLENHPGFREFKEHHPGVREEIHESPGRFMYREGHYEWRGEGRAINRRELGTADNYFDNHRDVYQALSKNPALIDNHEFVENHPGLHEYLQNHPYARRDLKEHPYRFIHREHRFDRRERAQS